MKTPSPLAALLLLAGANPAMAMSSTAVTIGIASNSNSCTAMKLTESNMSVTCSGTGGGCYAGDTATVTGNRKYMRCNCMRGYERERMD